MAKLASVPLPTGRTPDLEVDPETTSSVNQLLEVSNRRLLDVPKELWLGDRPTWLLDG